MYKPTPVNTTLLLEITGNQGNSWRNQQITINSTTSWQVSAFEFLNLFRHINVHPNAFYDGFLAWLFSKKTSRYCHSPVVIGGVCIVMQKL